MGTRDTITMQKNNNIKASIDERSVSLGIVGSRTRFLFQFNLLTVGILLIFSVMILHCGAENKKESATPNEVIQKEQQEGTTPSTEKATADKNASVPTNTVDYNANDPKAQADTNEVEVKPAPIPATEVDNALRLLRKGQYEQAINQSKAALRRNEKYVPAMVVMARAYFQLNKLEFAESICEIALSIEPTCAECLNLKGFIALKTDNEPLAIDQFDKATKAKANFGPPWLNLGAQYLKVKNYTAAISALEKATELMPNRAEAFLNLGSAYRGAGELVKAQQSYVQALKIRSTYPAAYFNLGILFLDAATFPGISKLQQLTMAIENFSKYKRQMTYLSKDDPVDSYIKEAQKSYEREQKQLLRDAQRRAREAAKKAAPAPATSEPNKDTNNASQPPAANPGGTPSGAEKTDKPQSTGIPGK